MPSFFIKTWSDLFDVVLLALFQHMQFCSKTAHSIIDASCLFSFHYVGGGFSFSGGGTNLLQNQWERHKRLISSIGTPFVSGRKK
jgi:hypothetical protein